MKKKEEERDGPRSPGKHVHQLLMRIILKTII